MPGARYVTQASPAQHMASSIGELQTATPTPSGCCAQAVQVRAAPFLVQEVPLPFSPHPAGAAWLKLKATAPPIGGVFDHHGAFYQQTAVRAHCTVHSEVSVASAAGAVDVVHAWG